MPSRKDEELTELLAKLYNIQEDIGAKPKTSTEEKKQKANEVATMGRGRKAEKKGSRFLELKSTIVQRLQDIHGMLKDAKSKEAEGYGGDNAKEMIKLQAEIRENIRQASDEWKEMDEIYKKEARKKKSKFTVEELNAQSEFCQKLHNELEKVKEAQMRGYAKNRNPSASVALNTKATYRGAGDDGPSWGSGGGGVGGGGASLTDGQRQQLQMIEQRDAEFDKDLDEIGEGIQDLAEIAQMQSEEVKRQSEMLDKVNSKMDKVQERMQNNNERLKDTLEEVGRAKDKLCVDIMCVVLMLGFGGVIYSFMG